MAISGNSVFEVRTGGSDINGGGFVTGASGTDYSQQNAKNTAGSNISTTDAVAVGTGVITSATAAFTAAIVGNVIYLQGGTGALAAGWYQVITFTSATSITVDRNVAAGTGITMNIGGALLSPGQANAIAITGNVVFIQNSGADGNSVYSITSVSSAVSGGIIGGAQLVVYQGYTSSRTLGNTDARPQLQLNVASATMFNSSSAIIQNLFCNGNSQTSARVVAALTFFIGCLFENFNTVSTAGSGAQFYRCSATANSATVFAGTLAVACEAYANTATAFTTSICVNCIASGNTGGSTDGFVSAGGIYMNCIAISNGRDGFRSTSNAQAIFINCHAEANGGYGFDMTTACKALINCSYFNNTSGGVFANTSVMSNTGAISVTAGSVFTNAGGNNFSLNNIVNQGALLRAAANPAIFPRGLTSNFRDIGAAQHQDTPAIFVIDD
jgi:hypothetical protein